MKKIEVTIQEIYDAMRPSVHRNRRRYTRKVKHKKQNDERDQRYSFSTNRFSDGTNLFTNNINNI